MSQYLDNPRGNVESIFNPLKIVWFSINLRTHKCQRCWGHVGTTNNISQMGNLLLTSTNMGTIKVWPFLAPFLGKGGAPEQNFSGPNLPIHSLGTYQWLEMIMDGCNERLYRMIVMRGYVVWS